MVETPPNLTLRMGVSWRICAPNLICTGFFNGSGELNGVPGEDFIGVMGCCGQMVLISALNCGLLTYSLRNSAMGPSFGSLEMFSFFSLN